MTELEELIQFWKDYHMNPETVYLDLLREKIRDTIKHLQELKKLQEGE